MKNILIVGASSGIGLSLAHRLSSENHQVYGTYRNTELASSANLEAHALDVESDFSLDFLPEQLDGVVYCPGTINLKPFARIKPEAFINDLNLQVVGAIKVIQACMSRLKNSDNSSILLFSTVAVQSGYNFHSQVSVSKGAIEGLTRSLAAEFAPKIRVNAIAPSLTDTPLAAKLLSTDQKREANAERHPLKRIGTTEDMASMGRFLLSEEASWITGQIIHIDGGMSAIR